MTMPRNPKGTKDSGKYKSRLRRFFHEVALTDRGYFVPSCEAERLSKGLEDLTAPHELLNPYLRPKPDLSGYFFRGKVYADNFRLIILGSPQQFYLPVAKGTIENTSKGSLVVVSFRFSDATNFFILLATAMCLLTSITFFFIAGNPLYGLYCLLGAIGHYLLALALFKRYVAEYKKAFNKVFDMPVV